MINLEVVRLLTLNPQASDFLVDPSRQVLMQGLDQALYLGLFDTDASFRLLSFIIKEQEISISMIVLE